MGVSVCIITRDEEQMILGCLLSVESFASEVVLVDTGSTDRTVEICRDWADKAGIELRERHMAWKDDFSAARNRGLEVATREWVLVIDADQRVTNPSELKRVVDSEPGSTAFTITECHDGHQYTGEILRLFRSKPGRRYYRAVHEILVDYTGGIGVAVKGERSAIMMMHLGYSPDRIAAKVERNRRLLMRWCSEHPDDLYAAEKLHSTLGHHIVKLRGAK